MREQFRFVGPYLPLDAPCRWLKGNHHGHSTRSDGTCAPAEEIAAYSAAGYDYMALSEHDRYFNPSADAVPSGPVLLPAVEVTSVSGQTLMYLGATADIPERRQRSLAEIAAFVAERGGLFVVDHPNWLYRHGLLHATAEEILAAPEVQAIEIYTGVIERMAGSVYALDVWDALLGAGRRVFGHAVDDQHRPEDRFRGWNLVQHPLAVGHCTPESIIAALRAGRFVASTGVSVDSIGISSDGRAIVLASDAREIAWISNGGVEVARVVGDRAELSIEMLLATAARDATSLDPERRYVRAELRGEEGTLAWTQPFFVEAAESALAGLRECSSA
jgi:hypothetical protein